MADNWVRLGLALSAIMLITASLYAACLPHAVAIEPTSSFARK